MRERNLIVALDFATKKEVDAFLSQFPKEKLFIKIGMELFYREGPEFVYHLKQLGHEIFLDLKLHDIPTTVKRAMKQLASLEIDLVNVHALGGVNMMAAAKEGLEAGTPMGKEMPTCIAVTQLTSTTPEMLSKEMDIHTPLQEHVVHLCQQVNSATLDGVVCSALEVPMIQEYFSDSFITVTPGIRRLQDATDDQARVVTPAKARELGSQAIVVGRGITRADQPKVAYEEYLREWRQ
ncbi:orotidine-5'-phosphate decarboxylase [Salipaludibacillus keqinensis]|uniref:Orotidine 5'-phosphate decarboxylase n=1 Tax=Salipaludibacillus keqinensis TaxID=2045207 RepID=A0A323TKV1_9BACI|nr:orotidine-5'-phosphate decarboxylase [Salipaludibacillus keqinensis]PYZ93213.1 orotidine-5'-phosphate decarboxylase [Salipaludibacillus keqinensis]